MAEQSVTIIYVCEKCGSRRSKMPDAAPTPDLAGETWLPVVRYEGLYEVSSAGRIRSLPRVTVRRDGVKRRFPGKLLSLSCKDYGYYQVSLCKNGVSERLLLHRLVCEAFHGAAPTPRMEVAHGDGNRLHNAAANLRWVSSGENSRDMIRHGTWNRGDRSSLAKLDDDKVRIIRASVDRTSASLAREFGVSAPTIREIRLRRKWRHVD